MSVPSAEPFVCDRNAGIRSAGATTGSGGRSATPYPARSTVGVGALPKGAEFEVEAILVV